MKKIKEIYVKVSLLIMDIAIIVLSAIPYSSVLKLSVVSENGNPGTSLKYFSCFDPINFGLANFGPFLSAYISVILLLLLLAFIFIKNDKYKNSIKWLPIFGLVFSLLPILLNFITVYGIIVFVLWLILTAVFMAYDRLVVAKTN